MTDNKNQKRESSSFLRDFLLSGVSAAVGKSVVRPIEVSQLRMSITKDSKSMLHQIILN